MKRQKQPRIDILYFCVIVLGIAIILLGNEMKRMNAEIEKQSKRVFAPLTITVTIPEPEQANTPQPPSHTYFDVPLEEELQDYIFDICDEYGVNPELIVSMIFHESNFDSDVIGENNSGYSYGLMQIMPRWNYERMERLGCIDLLNPYQNVRVGVDLIAEYIGRGHGIEWALMAYNGGPSYANRKAAEGVVSGYTTRIMDDAKTLCRASESLRAAV